MRNSQWAWMAPMSLCATSALVSSHYHLKLGDVKGGSAARLGCAAGTHFGTVELGSKGKRYRIHDAVVNACSVYEGLRTIAMKGHVTLIKGFSAVRPSPHFVSARAGVAGPAASSLHCCGR